MKTLLNKIHRLLGSSELIARSAVKVRNQMNCIIAYQLGEDADFSKNGEGLLVEQLAENVGVFIDVGANRGDWSAGMLEHGATEGICYDPSQQCAAFLKKRFDGEKVVVREAAVSDVAGTATFSEEDDLGVTSSLAQRTEKNAVLQREVPVVTLNNELKDHSTSIDYLKTDCEGWDLHALKGASEVLDRVRFIQFEYNSYWLDAGSSLQEALEYLRVNDFQTYLIRSTGLHPFNYDFWGDFYRFSNFFACRKSDLALVEPILGKRI